VRRNVNRVHSRGRAAYPGRATPARPCRRTSEGLGRSRKLNLEIRALAGLPEVQAGDDVAALIAPEVRDGDVVVIAQKVVSKAEGRIVALDSVVPGT
jgi:hypothetical protein